MLLDEEQAEHFRAVKLQARAAALRALEAAERAGDAERLTEARQAVRRIQVEIERYRLDD
jgi:hypothetical protein